MLAKHAARWISLAGPTPVFEPTRNDLKFLSWHISIRRKQENRGVESKFRRTTSHNYCSKCEISSLLDTKKPSKTYRGISGVQ
jgi:hypothetical protein